MSRPNDILVEWAEEQFSAGRLDPYAFVPLHGKMHAWHAWSRLSGLNEFQDIIHECLNKIVWYEDTHPAGVMLKLVYPIVYVDGWNGLFKDIERCGFLPLVVSRNIKPKNPSFAEQMMLDKGHDVRTEHLTHMILPSENDAVLVAAMTSIFDAQ